MYSQLVQYLKDMIAAKQAEALEGAGKLSGEELKWLLIEAKVYNAALLQARSIEESYND